MGLERIELSQRERDRFNVLHEVSEGHLTQVEAAGRGCARLRASVARGHVRIRGRASMKLNMYEAIGGRTKLNEAVTKFYEKVLADPNLLGFFARSNMNGVHAKQMMFLTMLLTVNEGFGKPDIHAAHAGSRMEGLTDAHFDAFLGHFRNTLVEMGVQEEAVEGIMRQLEATRKKVLDR